MRWIGDTVRAMASAIRFHFDVLSPYAYLAWTQVHALAARHGREVEPVPTLLAALLAEGRTRGPAEIPAKRAYLYRDTLRTARRLGIPYGPPPSHPFNPLLALRVASLDFAPDARRRVIDALFAAAWAGGGPGVEDPHAVAGVLARAGFDGPALVAAASGQEAKDRLRRQTGAAIAAGVFGVPTVIADGELFWGYDSFGHLDRFLAGDDPVTAADVAGFEALRPTASRDPR